MHQGRGGMGSHKHGISGKATKNARYKALTMLEARENERWRRRRKPLTETSVAKLFERAQNERS